MKSLIIIYSGSFLFGALLSYLSSTILTLIGGEFNAINQESDKTIFILSVIIGPPIETFIFQYLVFKIPYSIKCVKVNKITISILSLVSAFLFSLQHNYNMTYMVYAFILGLYFAILFAYAEYIKRNRTQGFTLVMCTHMFLNLIAGLSSL